MRLSKKIIFSLFPVFILFLSLEIAVRIKYFVYHRYNPYWLVVPFERLFNIAAPIPKADLEFIGKDNTKFIKVPKPCHNYEYMDKKGNKIIRYTYNDDCMRTNHQRKKDIGTFRIVMVGGSTVFGTDVDDRETVPYFLEVFLNQNAGRKFEVINAGLAGLYSTDFETLLPKLILYASDLILYYEAYNEINKSRFWVDEQIGAMRQLNNMAGFLNRLLHYRSLLYTYLTEKYYFIRQENQKLKNLRLFKYNMQQDNFWENIVNVILFCKRINLPVVFIKQVINAPLIIDSFDSLDGKQIEEAYMGDFKNLENNRIDTFQAINQRYVVYRIGRIAEQYNVPVIDFIADFDKRANKENFTDLVHQNAEGNKFLAQIIYENLLKYLK